MQEICPHCLKQTSFDDSSVCAFCGKDKTFVRFACSRCTQLMEAPRDSQGASFDCPSCGTEAVVPAETPHELIIGISKSTDEFSSDLARLRAKFLKAGLPEGKWESVFTELINLPRDKVFEFLLSRGIDCTTARAGARAIQSLGPSLRSQVAATSNKNIGWGSFFLIGGILVTVITYANAAQSGGTYFIAYGAIVTGAIQLCIGLKQNAQQGAP